MPLSCRLLRPNIPLLVVVQRHISSVVEQLELRYPEAFKIWKCELYMPAALSWKTAC